MSIAAMGTCTLLNTGGLQAGRVIFFPWHAHGCSGFPNSCSGLRISAATRLRPYLHLT